VIANTGDDDAGYVGDRFRQHGYELELCYRDSGDGPIGLDDVDVIILLGSDWSVYWDKVANHVERESDAVRRAAASDLPVLGICYGGQVMSHALGGSVERADITEIGWFDVASDDAALTPPGPWFEFHVDKFTPPSDAIVFASTAAGPQGYRLGRMLALQFHPEVTPNIIRRWGAESATESERYGIDFEAIYAQSDELDQQNRERCYQLVDAFLSEVVNDSSSEHRPRA
jgi:GMP synthase-like glutamine amidotransferase